MTSYRSPYGEIPGERLVAYGRMVMRLLARRARTD